MPVITVKKDYPEGWAICVDGAPTWFRKSKETALKHAAEIRKDLAGKYEHAGRAVGRNKKDAEKRFRDMKPSACKGRKLRLTYQYTDPPFRIYDVEWTTVNRYGKNIMFR